MPNCGTSTTTVYTVTRIVYTHVYMHTVHIYMFMQHMHISMANLVNYFVNFFTITPFQSGSAMTNNTHKID